MYLLLGVPGAVLPYSQFIPWIIEHGPNIELLFRQLFANRISGFFGWDVLVSAMVLVRFVRVEGKRLDMRLLWLQSPGCSRWACLSACRCFSIFAKVRSKDYQEQLKPYRQPSPDGIALSAVA